MFVIVDYYFQYVLWWWCVEQLLMVQIWCGWSVISGFDVFWICIGYVFSVFSGCCVYCGGWCWYGEFFVCGCGYL